MKNNKVALAMALTFILGTAVQAAPYTNAHHRLPVSGIKQVDNLFGSPATSWTKKKHKKSSSSYLSHGLKKHKPPKKLTENG